jgi:LPS O-antigen subunit length determinant protein (WzzB/FepE family)
MINNDSISFRDIITQIIAVVKYLFSKWLVICIVGMFGGAIGLIYALTAKPTYSATLNFVLSSNSSSTSSLMGFASQFGVNLNNDNDDVFAGDNIIALMKSRRMVQQAMFSKPVNSNKTLLNIYIRANKLNKDWQKNDRTKNIYPYPDDPSKMTMVQDSLFRTVYDAVQHDMLDVSKPNDNEHIYEVTTTSTNDTFSYYLTKYLVDATSSFYITTKTSTAAENLDMLQKEADSLRRVLGGVITEAGSQTDLTFNLNPAYQVQRSGVQQSQARAGALGQAYGQVLQNLELAKITLQKETPLYQIIDEPTLPLIMDKPGKLTSIIIGGCIAGFLVCSFLIAMRFWKSLKQI